MHGSTESIIHDFQQVRARTLEIVKPLEKEDYVAQSMRFMSPPRWHMGHVAWLYEAIINLVTEGTDIYDADYFRYFNSYVRALGKISRKGTRGQVSRPTVEETIQYMSWVNDKISMYAESSELGSNGGQAGAANVISHCIQHELQHQELLAFDLKHLLGDRYHPVKKEMPPKSLGQVSGMVDIPGGLFELGYHGSGYSFDNERPLHKIYLEPYKMDLAPVTNGDYLDFMADGGYQDHRFWLFDGWSWVINQNVGAPLYWKWDETQDCWMVQDYLGYHAPDLARPVCHVNYYEADAYARWAGKRLPTEAEWEKAASWDPAKGTKRMYPWGDHEPTAKYANLAESNYWSETQVGAYPEGVSPYGCHQMIGDVWEWTASEHVGYPGFEPFLTAEYNAIWFVHHKVLRGGSFGTPKETIRNSYRNFYRPGERHLFAGFRCARDAK